MFIGFIALIIILLIIVATMTSSILNTNTGLEETEATKFGETIGLALNESKFYLSLNYGNDFSSPNVQPLMEYLKDVGFSKDNMKEPDTMLASEWLGTSQDYTGPYVIAGGHMGDNVRIISRNAGSSGIILQVIGKDLDGDGQVDNVDKTYVVALERKLQRMFPNNFIGF